MSATALGSRGRVPGGSANIMTRGRYGIPILIWAGRRLVYNVDIYGLLINPETADVYGLIAGDALNVQVIGSATPSTHIASGHLHIYDIVGNSVASANAAIARDGTDGVFDVSFHLRSSQMAQLIPFMPYYWTVSVINDKGDQFTPIMERGIQCVN